MYQIQSDKIKYFEKEIGNFNREIRYRFYLNDNLIDNSVIKDSVKITTDLGLEQYAIGNVVIQTLNFTLVNTLPVNYNDVIRIEIGIQVYNESTHKWEILYTPVGLYYVEAIEQKGSNLTIKAYDGMSQIRNQIMFNKNFTTTLELATFIATESKLKLRGISKEENNIAIYGNKDLLNKHTVLELLSYLASAIGGHVRLTREGDCIEFFDNDITGVVVKSDNLTSPTLDNNTIFEVTKLVVKYSEPLEDEDGDIIDEGQYIVGEGDEYSSLILENPLLKGQENRVSSILQKIQKLNGYRRFDTTFPLADYRLEPLDIITCEVYEEVYIVPILYHCMTLTAKGVSIEVQAPTIPRTKSEFSFKGSISKRLEEVSDTVSNITTEDGKIDGSMVTDLPTSAIPELTYTPNYIYNSSFARFNESLRPEYWDTNAVVSNVFATGDNYSLHMRAGEYCYQQSVNGVELLDCSKWSDLSTRYSFRVMGKGKLKVSLYTNNKPLQFQAFDNSELVLEYVITANKDYWDATIPYFTLPPCSCVVQLRFECIEGYVYIDSVMGHPQLDDNKVLLYQHGNKSSKDYMTIVESDLVDAPLGAMWFVKK